MRHWIHAAVTLATLASPGRGQQIEDFRFEVTTLGGQALTQEGFRDSVLLVDFWGTWCGPCVGSVPFLQELYAKYKHHGLEIVGLTYESGDQVKAADAVRRFAADEGLTYHLALGTPAERQQVPNFRGYPTMLFFKRGLEFDHLDVGIGPDWRAETERWIRAALELPVADDENPSDRAGRPADEPPPANEPPPLPQGVIFKPGDGDRGFAFEIRDIDAETLSFASLRGEPVVLALTSTWDAEAVKTAQILQRLHERFAESEIPVLAASLEIEKQDAAKITKIKAFRAEHDLGYRLFPAGLGFQKKIHLFSGMPLFLVFDAEGVLILRKSGASETTEDEVRAAVESAM